MITKSLSEESKMQVKEGDLISDHDSDSENWNFPTEIEDSYLNFKTNAPNSVAGQSSIEGSATGMLILDTGSSSRRSIQVDALSYPDSIPTEIMSLDGERYQNIGGDNFSRKSKNTIYTTDGDNHQSTSGRKRLLQIASIIILSLVTFNGYLVWHHRELQQRHEKLETQIDDLLNEVKEMKLPKLVEDEIINNDAPKFALFNNCWFKAEIEIGDCLNDIKECWTDIASHTYQTFNTIFDYSDNDNAEYNTTDAITILQADWNQMFVETSDNIANATTALFGSILYSGKTIEQSIWNATQTIEQSIWYATEQVRDIIQDASIYSKM